MDAKVTQGAEADDQANNAGRGGKDLLKPVVALGISVFAILAVSLGVSAWFGGRVGLTLMAIAADFMVIFTASYWPSRGMGFERLLGAIGAVALIASTQFSLLQQLLLAEASGRQASSLNHSAGFGYISAASLLRACTQWGVGLMVVFVVFVILGFGRQMLRRDRSNMVRSLAYGLVAGVTMVGASGWLFASVLVRYFTVDLKSSATGPFARFGQWVVVVVVALAVLVMACLLVAVTRWWRDLNVSDKALSNRRSSVRAIRRGGWVGVGLAAPMLSGFVVYLVLVVLLLVVG
jgi:hypothetical protein